MPVLRAMVRWGVRAVAAIAVASLGTSSALANTPSAVATPTILAPADVIVGEADGTIDLEVRLSDEGLSTVTVLYEASSLSAVGGTTCNFDFVAEGGQLTFTPGDTSEIVSLEILDCPGDHEPFESFSLIFRHAVNATFPWEHSRVGIVDNDTVVTPPDVPNLSARDAIVDEKDGVALVPVLLGGAGGQASSETVTVGYATSAGTAAATDDFPATSGTLTFAPDETAKTIEIPIADDTDAEPAEDFTLELSDPSGATISDVSGRVSIGPSDDPAVASPWISVAPDAIVGEADGFVDLAVTLSAPPLATLEEISVNTFPLTAELGVGCGGDFTTGGRVLTWAPGETTKVIRADILDCPAIEGFESFALDLGDRPQLNIRRQLAQVGIVDNDTVVPTSILAVRGSAVDEQDGVAHVSVLLGGAGGRASGGTVSVGYTTTNGTAAAPGDYTTTSGTLTFAPGETVKTLFVPIADDSSQEPAETFSVVLSGESGATISDGSALLSIGANDAAAPEFPTLFTSPDVVVGEAEGFVDVVVRLDRPGTAPIRVLYSAFPRTATGTTGCNGDFPIFFGAAIPLVTFLPGETTKSVRVDIVDCPVPVAERLESFVLSVSPISDEVEFGRGDTQIAIVDNDTVVPAPPLVARDAVVDEKEGFARVDVLLGGPAGRASAGPVMVQYATADGMAQAGEDFTQTSGMLTFAPGETVKTVLVPIVDDDAGETAESFSLALFGDGATIADGSGTISIGPSDGTAVAEPSLSIADAAVAEGDGWVDLVVSLSQPGTSTASVIFFTFDGSAEAGVDCDLDYEETFGVLTFEPGETTKVARVHLIDCPGAEHLEFLEVVLIFPFNATISKDFAVVEIADEQVPILTGLSVTPANLSVPAGVARQFTATGIYGDAPQLDVTDSAAWSSFNPAVATVNGSGLAQTAAPGTTTISATFGGFTAATQLTVTGPLLNSISITPANHSLMVGSAQQLTATGSYSNGTSANLTSQVTWTSANPGIATVSAGGLARGVSPGGTTITATLGVTASTNLTVTAAAPAPPPPPPPPKQCRVPKVVGKKLAAAKPALKRRLCRAGKVTKAYSRKVKKGRVISQSRRAGRVLPVNSKVNLVVSRGPKRVVRPADARDLRRARSLPHNR